MSMVILVPKKNVFKRQINSTFYTKDDMWWKAKLGWRPEVDDTRKFLVRLGIRLFYIAK